MLLTISTTHNPATDLGYLLHKHPDRFQSFELSFGSGHVFYPEANEDRCTACLMLDVDLVEMARGRKRRDNTALAHYVNDRPYVASSFMSTAISQVFGSALAGRCKDRVELVGHPLALEATIEVLPVKGGDSFLRSVFEPLGYEVEAQQHVLDENFPEWGDSPYFSVKLTGELTLSELLNHLYVLIPVFDNQKHYFVGRDELDKLLAKGEGWLSAHPEKEAIARRYLKFQPSLVRQALARLVEDEEDDAASDEQQQVEDVLEKPLSLNDQRLGAVIARLPIPDVIDDPASMQTLVIEGAPAGQIALSANGNSALVFSTAGDQRTIAVVDVPSFTEVGRLEVRKAIGLVAASPVDDVAIVVHQR